MNAKTSFVVAVSVGQKHNFQKQPWDAVTLVAGLGIEGDAHSGVRVQHLYDKARDPARQNCRQVHLIEAELIDELRMTGFDIQAGELGENITTRHLHLIELKAGTVLRLGRDAAIKVTGLRVPCVKIERFQQGLRSAVTFRDKGYVAMKGAIMAVVITSGIVRAGDVIEVREPDDAEARELRPV